MTKNNKYWQDRFLRLQEANLKKGQRYYYELEKQYKLAASSIEKEIANWYQRFAVNNDISLTKAKRLLNSKELSEFKWDVEKYIKFGKENAINQKWMKELENASARVHISRLEALNIQIQQKIEVLYGNQIDGIDKLARNIYSEGYYHTAYEIQKGFNIGYDLQELNDKQFEKVISKPWTADNSTFKDRCWSNKQNLVNTVHTEFTQNIIRGDSPDKAIKTIAKKFNVSKNKAGRLVMTESAFFSSAAQEDAFKTLDVEKYEIVATLDNSTSEICQGLDGEVFLMKDYEVGVTAPPFHPWCRTVTVPYFEDDYGERAARGADGKTYYVPSNMKYADWKKTFVNGGSKEGKNNDIINIKSIKDCKNIKEVNEFVLNELKPYGIEKVDFTGLDLKLAQENGEQLINLQKKYNNNLNCIQAIDCGSNIYAHVVRVGSDKTSIMELSPRYFKKYERLQKNYTDDVLAKFHPKGTEEHSAISILTHEFGHTLSSNKQFKVFGYDSEFWKKIESIKRKYSRALTAIQKKRIVTHEITYDEMQKEISKIFISDYAKKNADEFLAEAFVMAELNSEPSPFAVEVLKVIEEYFLRGD